MYQGGDANDGYPSRDCLPGSSAGTSECWGSTFLCAAQSEVYVAAVAVVAARLDVADVLEARPSRRTSMLSDALAPVRAGSRCRVSQLPASAVGDRIDRFHSLFCRGDRRSWLAERCERCSGQGGRRALDASRADQGDPERFGARADGADRRFRSSWCLGGTSLRDHSIASSRPDARDHGRRLSRRSLPLSPRSWRTT